MTEPAGCPDDRHPVGDDQLTPVNNGPKAGILPSQAETVVLKPGSGSWAGVDLVGRIAAPE